MTSHENIYTEKFKVRSYEVDVTGKATILTISNFLQEVAGNHAGKLGLSVDKLFKQNLTWVLSRLHLQMTSYPMWRESVTINTWPSDAYGKFATRDFEIFNSGNDLIGNATSSWMLLDLLKMKPMKMPEFITSINRPERKRAIDDKFDKLPRLEKSQFQKKYNVRLSDLDLNQHVNNVNYIEWAIETVPIEIQKKYELTQFEIGFRAESKYGDQIVSRAQESEKANNMIMVHSLINKGTEIELAIAKSKWSKRN